METSSSIPILVGLFFLLLMSAFFSASETAYSSLNLIRLKSMAVQGKKRAVQALWLSEHYDKLLSTVLVGNNIVNIASSALATVLLVGWFGNAGVTLATIIMTILVLFFGEISPKTLAKEQPEAFALFAAPLLRLLLVILTPVNALFSAWKRFLLRIFHIGGAQNMTEEELLAYVEEAHEEGGINEDEAGMIRQAIEFDEMEAGEILTPRVDITAVAMDDPPEGIAALFHETGYSRLPVYDRSMDDIRGVLIQKDFHYYVQQGGQSLESVLKPVVFATKQVKISKLLKQLQIKKTHMAVIVDEYGGTVGLVTIEDILEELVGEIWDEHDEVVQTVVDEGNGIYRILGSADLHELETLFDMQGKYESATVGGWVVETLGRFPENGESFEAEGLKITVTNTVRQRVLEVRAQKALPHTEEQPAETKEEERQTDRKNR
ncbi:hemolysin family protein [Ruminococcaceae bacterium OttesenSCG-928-I18]|nr:hemolysin family protein [Ruminococcaceae bacterium OttesenSCG-928-I18]